MSGQKEFNLQRLLEIESHGLGKACALDLPGRHRRSYKQRLPSSARRCLKSSMKSRPEKQEPLFRYGIPSGFQSYFLQIRNC
jgi:hypothetical protein